VNRESQGTNGVAWPMRIEYTGAVYHVITRGINRLDAKKAAGFVNPL